MNETITRDTHVTVKPTTDYRTFLQPRDLCPMQKAELVQSVAALLGR